jgi:hypothetical protein
MNGYIAFYNGKRIELRADSLYRAKLDALKAFGVHPMATKKAYQVHVELAEVDGQQVTTTIT